MHRRKRAECVARLAILFPVALKNAALRDDTTRHEFECAIEVTIYQPCLPSCHDVGMFSRTCA